MSSNASSKHPVRVPPEKREELYRLTNPPKVAWPSIAVFAYVVGGIIAVDAAALYGLIPLWVGSILNVFTMYPFFHVMHDSMHRALSSNIKVNDWIGRIMMLSIGSLGSLESVRIPHIAHHRFTNDVKDPDHYFHGAWWTLPLRWMTVDYYYVLYTLRSGDPRARKVIIDSIPYTLFVLSIIVGVISFGYGWELLMLWYLPQRIALGLIAFTFLWLPHLDGDENGELGHIHPAASTAENLTAGTTMRLGNEWFFSPALLWHHYHLIHHLWPTTPSYNHAKVWKLMEPELRERDLRIQKNFDLIPTLHTGSMSAAAAQ